MLDALGEAVAAGKVGWNQPLTVTAQLKSLPPGELQDEPDGTRVSVLDTAAAMTSLSEDTATDMLINLLGRPAVEAALTRTAMADPALDRPFLTTREIFTLKLRQWPALAGVPCRGPSRPPGAAGQHRGPRTPARPGRGGILDCAAGRQQPGILRLGQRPVPRLRLPRRPGPPAGLAPIGQLLSLNDDGLQLDPAQWKTTWFKGGSEPGVLTLAFMATTRTGNSYVVTVLAENPSQPINQATAIPAILSAVKAAFTLAARAVNSPALPGPSDRLTSAPQPSPAFTRPLSA